jgi:hypothetical protein
MTVMTNDDESILSAYMDGQLDPEQQQRVEAVVAASPQLAEKLRGLSMVRDMVAGLPHDGWVDVSLRVVHQIQARGSERGLLPTLERWRSGSRRILPLAGLAATAAVLMMAASLALLLQTSQLERGAGPVAELQPDEFGEPAAPGIIPVRVDGHAISSALEAPAFSSDHEIPGALADHTIRPTAVAHDRDLKPIVDAGELSHSGNLEHLRRFLDDPSLKRFFLVQSGPKNDSERAVASVVEHTTHLDYFKITVAQGIVIDPRHPDEATVFAFVVDPNQVDRFHDQLKAALPGLVEQKPLDPAIATALAEISEVQSLSPTLLAKVEIPREALALRTKASASERLHNETEVVSGSRETGPTATPLERETNAARALESPSRSGQATTKASSPASRDRTSEPTSGVETSRSHDRMTVARPPTKPHGTVVVLVWVAQPRAR